MQFSCLTNKVTDKDHHLRNLNQEAMLRYVCRSLRCLLSFTSSRMFLNWLSNKKPQIILFFLNDKKNCPLLLNVSNGAMLTDRLHKTFLLFLSYVVNAKASSLCCHKCEICQNGSERRRDLFLPNKPDHWETLPATHKFALRTGPSWRWIHSKC